MKTLIIYGSTVKLTPAHRLVFSSGALGQPQYWIRIIPTEGDIDIALENARPFPEETVLNVVALGGAE